MPERRVRREFSMEKLPDGAGILRASLVSRDPVANSIREPVFDAAVGAAPVLRAVAAEAPRDPHAADVLTAFAGTRRAALRSRLVRVVGAAGRAVDDDSLDMAVDQVHGVLCTAC